MGLLKSIMKAVKTTGKTKKTPANKRTKTSKSKTSSKNGGGKSRTTSCPKRVEAPYPHFRYYKKSKHPALIVGEQKDKETKVDEYRYRKVMHAEKDGKRNNEKVYPNPDPKDKEPMYIGRRVRHDKKESFNEKPLPWKYSKKKDE